MGVTVDDVKIALNLDDSDDTALLGLYLKSAQNYVKNAIGEDKSGTFYAREDVADLYDTAVISLTGTYFTYRIALADTQSYPIDFTLNSIIGQLRGIYAVYESEADNG